MNLIRVLAALFSLGPLAGCSDKPTPVVVVAAPRPHIEVSPEAREALTRLAAGFGFGSDWWVRLDVVWRPDARIEVHLDRTPPGPADFVCDAGGVRCVLARKFMVYLKGARVEWVATADGGEFDVTFVNQDARDREASGRWFREESARRKAGGKGAGKE